MNSMLIEKYFNRFDTLNQRERISVAVLILVSLAILFYVAIIEPIALKVDSIRNQLANVEVQIKAGETQIATLQKVLAQDPDTENRKQLAQLQEQQKLINTKLREKMQGLIEPAQMAKVLEAVVTKTSNLSLERLKNLPTQPLIDSNDDETSRAISDVGVYRHGLQIELRGSYMNMLAYLDNLKSLPWDFYWDTLELQVRKYPESHIIITVHTLSFKEGWIGV
ncbi:MAG: type II secretion system protein M [Gammaproteobacteria bacterium]|nr:type II secretion system protein M [Gammaproteobacteria bacterium]